MVKFSIEEFRTYLTKQDSLGDAFYHLSEENIILANGEMQALVEDVSEYDYSDDDLNSDLH